jgi:hypothetical protein
MSLFTRDDFLILKSVFRKEDFFICQNLFEETTFLGFLEARDLDLSHERTQSKLRHLITVVKNWSCVKEKINSFATTTGIDLSDPTPFSSVWTGLCTSGCPLCYSMKNYSLKNEYYLGKSWKHRAKYQRFHSNMITTVTNFLQDNIVLMVDKYCQDELYASDYTSGFTFEPLVEEETDAGMDRSAVLDQTSLKREAGPLKVRRDLLLSSSLFDRPLRKKRPIFGLAADCFAFPELDHVEEDEPRKEPISISRQMEEPLGAGPTDYHPDHSADGFIIGDYTQMG